MKPIRFGQENALASTAPLLMLGSIEACRPRRKRSRGGTPTALFLALLVTFGLAAWLVLDGAARGIIPFLPG